MDWVPLPAPINPLAAVRRTTAEVVERAIHISLNNEAMEELAKMWATEGGAGGAGVGWNESGWHYSEDAAAGGTLTCQYVFVLGESLVGWNRSILHLVFCVADFFVFSF